MPATDTDLALYYMAYFHYFQEIVMFKNRMKDGAKLQAGPIAKGKGVIVLN